MYHLTLITYHHTFSWRTIAHTYVCLIPIYLDFLLIMFLFFFIRVIDGMAVSTIRWLAASRLTPLHTKVHLMLQNPAVRIQVTLSTRQNLQNPAVRILVTLSTRQILQNPAVRILVTLSTLQILQNPAVRILVTLSTRQILQNPAVRIPVTLLTYQILWFEQHLSSLNVHVNISSRNDLFGQKKNFSTFVKNLILWKNLLKNSPKKILVSKCPKMVVSTWDVHTCHVYDIKVLYNFMYI